MLKICLSLDLVLTRRREDVPVSLKEGMALVSVLELPLMKRRLAEVVLSLSIAF